MKNGGAAVRIFRRDDRGPRLDSFIASSTEIAERRADMCGFAIVAWDREGGTSVMCGTIGAPVPLLMLPEFVKTAVADWSHAAPAESFGPVA